jgi:hypothetical protein
MSCAIRQPFSAEIKKEYGLTTPDAMKKVQFLQSMLQGLPISTVSNVPQAQTGSQQAVGGMTSIYQMLQNLGVIPKA